MEKINSVIWTKRSSIDLKKIFDFTLQQTNQEKASKTVNNIIDFVENSLLNKLDVGAKDQQFAHKGNYKKILIGNHKVTFRSENEMAYVIRVFDMRQHPDKNK